MLYNLGIGFGGDPLDPHELGFVFEKGLKVTPTAATVLASGSRGSGPTTPEGKRLSALNMTKVLHGEQKVELHKPLPASGSFTASSRTAGVYDKGADKGAIVVNETTWTDDAGDLAATLTTTIFVPRAATAASAAQPRASRNRIRFPRARPTCTVDLVTRRDQASCSIA